MNPDRFLVPDRFLAPDARAAKVKLPVILSGGQWRLASDEPIPILQEGTSGTLIVPRDAFEDQQVAHELSHFKALAALPAESVLEFRLYRVAENQRTTGCHYRQMQLRLLEELRMARAGTRKAQCCPCGCEFVPGGIRAESLNHAYALASQSYEPNRRSHSGNVFASMFYKDGGTWRPLAVLRFSLFGD